MRYDKRWPIPALFVVVATWGAAWAEPPAAEPAPQPPSPAAAVEKDQEADKGDEKSGQDRRDRQQRFFDAMFRDIALTAEQREKAQAVIAKRVEARRAWMDEHRDALREARNALRDASQAADEAKIEAAKAQLLTLLETYPKREAAMDEIRSLLTGEQQEVFARNLDGMRKWRENKPKPEREEQTRPAGDAGASPGAGQAGSGH